MGNLKNNIDHYMELKGIKMYSHLLVNIAHELGIKGQDAYKFANKEKSNFSKMLKEERPLKYEFIIPLEKIFGVSLARLLDNDTLFSSIFEIRPYEYVLAGSRVKREKQVDSITYYSINPIINNCLRYSLEHLEKYKHRTIDILKFGIKHNTEIINKVGADTYCICNELGGVIDSGRTDWFSCDVDNIAVYVAMEVNDDEINALIKQLPKFKKRY